MLPSESIEAVLVLAAGRGKRMGSPKALMVHAGLQWWRTQRSRLATWNARELWVVSPEVAGAIRTESDSPNMVITDPEAPMFASIAAGIRALRTDPPPAVSILPVDVPACTGATFKALRCETHHPTVPTHDGHRGHPIRLPWPFIVEAILPRLDDPAWIASTRLDALVRSAVVDVPVHDPSVGVNLNTPEDLVRWIDQTLPPSGG